MKRWIIRSLFVGLLLLFVGGWVESYQYEFGITYVKETSWTLEGKLGRINLKWYDGNWDFWDKGWFFGFCPAEERIGFREYILSDNRHDFLGFVMQGVEGEKWAGIPFWFPTTLSAALLMLVWRQTRPPVKGRAFPVEVAKPSEKL